MDFIGKYPLEVLVGSTCPKRSNWVLGASISLNFLSGIVSAQASKLRSKYAEIPISMSVASSINKLQFAPKPTISLLSNGQVVQLKVLRSVSALMIL